MTLHPQRTRVLARLRALNHAARDRFVAFLAAHGEATALLGGIGLGLAVGDLLVGPLVTATALLAVLLFAIGRRQHAGAAVCAVLGLLVAFLFLAAHAPLTEAQAEILARYGGDPDDGSMGERLAIHAQILIAAELLVLVALFALDAGLDLWRNREEHLRRWEAEAKERAR